MNFRLIQGISLGLEAEDESAALAAANPLHLHGVGMLSPDGHTRFIVSLGLGGSFHTMLGCLWLSRGGRRCGRRLLALGLLKRFKMDAFATFDPSWTRTESFFSGKVFAIMKKLGRSKPRVP